MIFYLANELSSSLGLTIKQAKLKLNIMFMNKSKIKFKYNIIFLMNFVDWR